MATTIVQEPLYEILPVGQEIIFTVENNAVVATEKQVKFGVEVHISNDTMPVTATSNHLIGIFKVTPNNAGVGIFDLRTVIENYVAADNRSASGDGLSGPQYKNQYANEETYPIHLIDKYSMSTKINAFMVLQFFAEYLGATSNGVANPNVVARADGTTVNSNEYSIFNGYVKRENIIKVFNNNYGYDTTNFQPANSTRRFLTNLPVETDVFGNQRITTQCNYNDYGTIAIYQPNSTTADFVYAFICNFYDSTGVIQGTCTVAKAVLNGAYSVGGWTEDTEKQIIYFGCFPGNFQNWSAFGSNIPAASVLEGGYILVSAVDVALNPTMRTIRINVNCPEQKNYEPIRLCWLNQWGGWDYWTFTKKSTRSYKGKQTTYNQLAGAWNEGMWHPNTYRGGKKTFRANSTEEIKINTDYVSEDYNEIFEELTTSPEIYLLEGYQADGTFNSLNRYVTPVTLKTSNFTVKTAVNDNLIQYSFTIKKTKTLRTQAI